MTLQRLIVACCIAFLVMFGIYEAAPPVESFLAAHGWSRVTGAAEVVVVEDMTKPTPEIGQAVTAIGLAAGKRQIAWHVVDITQTGADVAEIQWALDAAKSKNLPVFCYRHGTGKAVVKPLPDAKGSVELVQAL